MPFEDVARLDTNVHCHHEVEANVFLCHYAGACVNFARLQ